MEHIIHNTQRFIENMSESMLKNTTDIDQSDCYSLCHDAFNDAVKIQEHPTIEEAKAYIPTVEQLIKDGTVMMQVPPEDYLSLIKERVSANAPDRIHPNISHAWCRNCDEIRPVRIDNMGGKDVSGKLFHPTDIVCNECDLIIATLFSNKE